MSKTPNAKANSEPLATCWRIIYPGYNLSVTESPKLSAYLSKQEKWAVEAAEMHPNVIAQFRKDAVRFSDGWIAKDG